MVCRHRNVTTFQVLPCQGWARMPFSSPSTLIKTRPSCTPLVLSALVKYLGLVQRKEDQIEGEGIHRQQQSKPDLPQTP